MKPRIVLLLLVISWSFIFSGCQTEKNHITTQRALIKIGAILPLSGKVADWGERTKRGIDLALEEVNRPNQVLEVIYEDSEASIEKAVSLTQKLIHVEKVQVLFCQLSGVCSAIASIAQDNKVILFGYTDTPNLTQVGDYVFNLRGSSIKIGEKLGEFSQRKYRIATIFYLNNPTLIGEYEGFKKIFTNQIVLTQTHEKDENDFKTILTKTKELGPEVVLFLSRVPNTINFVKQIKELGLNKPILCNSGIDTQDFLGSLGDLAEGIIYPSTMVNYETNNLELRDILEKYQEKYNEQMPMWAAESYDGVKLLNFVIRNGARTPEQIRNILMQIKSFPGLSADITFDETRTILKDYYLFTIKDGEFVRYEE